MGAVTFETRATGPTARDAFSEAREAALYNYGHAGYTGTLAEKESHIRIDDSELEGLSPTERVEYARDLIDAADPRIDSKWGPAGAILLNDDADPHEREWLFFGWASS